MSKVIRYTCWAPECPEPAVRRVLLQRLPAEQTLPIGSAEVSPGLDDGADLCSIHVEHLQIADGHFVLVAPDADEVAA